MLVGLVPRVAAAAPQPLRAARAVGLADVGRRQVHFKRRGELARDGSEFWLKRLRDNLLTIF